MKNDNNCGAAPLTIADFEKHGFKLCYDEPRTNRQIFIVKAGDSAFDLKLFYHVDTQTIIIKSNDEFVVQGIVVKDEQEFDFVLSRLNVWSKPMRDFIHENIGMKQ